MFRRIRATLGNTEAKSELEELDKIKNELMRRCEIPAKLKCPVSQTLLSAPVAFSPFGSHWVFNKDAIINRLKNRAQAQCPETNNALSEAQLIYDDEADNALRIFHKKRDQIVAEIQSLSSRKVAKSAAFQDIISNFQLTIEECYRQIIRYGKRIQLRIEIDALAAKVPNELICPVTREKLDSPRVTKTGHAYSHWAIEQILNNENASSPQTRGPLSEEDYVVESEQVKAVLVEFNARNTAFIQSMTVLPEESTARAEMKRYDEDIMNIVRKLGNKVAEVRFAPEMKEYEHAFREAASLIRNADNHQTIIYSQAMINNAACQQLLGTNPKYVQLIHECDLDEQSIKSQMDHVTDADQVRTLDAAITAFQEKMQERKKRLTSIQNQIVAREEAKPIIENVKLDMNNKEHLQFWHGLRRGSSATPIHHPNEAKGERGFTVPKHIHKMMKVVKEEHESKEEFVTALDKARKSWGANPFARFFRHKTTAAVYSAHDIEHIKVDELGRSSASPN